MDLVADLETRGADAAAAASAACLDLHVVHMPGEAVLHALIRLGNTFNKVRARGRGAPRCGRLSHASTAPPLPPLAPAAL
jgi:hypothetical protein